MSFCDHGGRLFWLGEDLYRGVTTSGEPTCRQMFDGGTVDRLVGNGLLVETELTDLKLDGFPLVLKHRRLPFVSYPFESSFEMLHDAAECILNLEMGLARDGLTCLDCNPWNIVFDGTRPVYVDFCSIHAASVYPHTLWYGYDEFLWSCLYPLKLMSAGHDRLARSLNTDRERGVAEATFDAVMRPATLRRRLQRRLKRYSRGIYRRLPEGIRGSATDWMRFQPDFVRGPLTPARRLAFLERVRSDLLRVKPPKYRRDAVSAPAVPDAELAAVKTVIGRLQPSSILHVDMNDHAYAHLAAELSGHAVSCSADPAAAGELYRQAKRDRTGLLPLVMDFRFPSPGIGLHNEELPPASTRLRCELVLAPNAVSELAFGRALRFDQIAGALAAFSTRWALLKFASAETAMPEHMRNSHRAQRGQEWYTLENLTTALLKYFEHVERVVEFPDSQVLLLCRK
jgi:hypothetical protein